ncbi:MAG: sarcosine oxidase subunit gamma family protein [Burkholderiaceae bacterium]
MSDFSLAPSPPLKNFRKQLDGLLLAEVADCAVVSVAIPLGGSLSLGDRLHAVYGVDMPAAGKSATSSPTTADTNTTKNTKILWLAHDLMFFIVEQAYTGGFTETLRNLGHTAYITDQSDAWAILSISGLRSREALERICPIDLHPDKFQCGDVARTLMEHHDVIIFRDNDDSFILLSPASSAQSFLHTIQTSIRSIFL